MLDTWTPLCLTHRFSADSESGMFVRADAASLRSTLHGADVFSRKVSNGTFGRNHFFKIAINNENDGFLVLN